MGSGIEYFCAGEFVVAKGQTQPIDEWVAFTEGRCGTFDFSFREALLEMVKAGGFFDMGSLPNFQQSNRLKTVPFVNSHDTQRGPFHDSHHPGDGSGARTIRASGSSSAATPGWRAPGAHPCVRFGTSRCF
jgi:hypothetical protein